MFIIIIIVYACCAEVSTSLTAAKTKMLHFILSKLSAQHSFQTLSVLNDLSSNPTNVSVYHVDFVSFHIVCTVTINLNISAVTLNYV